MHDAIVGRLMLFFGCVYLRELLLVMKRRGILCCTFLLLFLSLLAINADNVFVNSGSILVTEPTTRVLSYTPSDPILIQSDADFETQGWPGEGTVDQPYMLSSLIINTSDNAIAVFDTNVHFIIEDCILLGTEIDPSTHGVVFGNVVNGSIRNCTIYSKLYGILFNNANHSSIDDCIVYDNKFDGIFYTNSNNCTVSNSTLFNNGNQAGIYLYDSEDCILFNDTSYSNHDGICTSATGSNITISNCTTFQNEEDGIYINSANSRVENSLSFENGNNGISITFGTNVEVVNNRLHSNNDKEIKLWLSSSNVNVYYNKIGPTIGGDLARDDGTGNSWDDGISKGNYWSDFLSIHGYEISGTAGSSDGHPLKLIIKPLINHPPDIEYHVGATGHNITWNPSGLCLNSYETFRNDTLLVSDDWNEFPIVVSVDGLEPGVYTYRIDVYDSSENKAVDNVMVSVIGDVITTSTQNTTTTQTTTTTQDTTNPTLFILLICGAIGAFVVIVLFFKIRSK